MNKLSEILSRHTAARPGKRIIGKINVKAGNEAVLAVSTNTVTDAHGTRPVGADLHFDAVEQAFYESAHEDIGYLIGLLRDAGVEMPSETAAPEPANDLLSDVESTEELEVAVVVADKSEPKSRRRNRN